MSLNIQSLAKDINESTKIIKGLAQKSLDIGSILDVTNQSISTQCCN